MKLIVRPQPAELSPGQQDERDLTFAQYWLDVGEPKRAVEYANAMLKRHPDDAAALALKGDVLLAQGLKKEAFALYARAVQLWFAANPEAPEPPRELLEKYNALFGTLLKANGVGR